MLKKALEKYKRKTTKVATMVSIEDAWTGEHELAFDSIKKAVANAVTV